MKKNLQDIDKIFKDALDEHLEPAPPGVWDTINNDLDKKQAFHFKEKYFRLRRLALALLLFVFSGVAYLLYFVKPAKNNPVTQNHTVAGKNNTGTDASSGSVTNKETVAGKEVIANKVVSSNNENKTEPVVSDAPHVTEKPINKKENSTADANDLTGENTLKTSTVAANKKASAKINAAANTQPDTHASNNKLAVIEKGKAGNQFSIRANSQQLSSEKNSKRKLILQQNGAASHQMIAANTKDHITKGLAKKGDHNYLQDNQNVNTTVSGVNRQLATTNNKNSQASLLSACLYQPTLLIAPIEYATPGDVTRIDGSGLLSDHIIQNDSLLKALAALPKKTPYRHAVSLMAFASPNHSFTRLENDDLLAGPGRNKNAAEREEHQGASYSAGILINYGLTKSIILQSGVVFSSAKTIISPKTIYARPVNNGHAQYEFNCSSGYSYITPKTGPSPAVGDSIKVMGSSSSISYIGVPLSLNYVWQRGRFLLKPGIGLSVNFLTSGKSETRLGSWAGNEKETSVIAGLKTAYVDGSIGLGAEWMINRKISVGIRPLLRMALSSINKDTPVKMYQNYLSWETGIKINL